MERILRIISVGGISIRDMADDLGITREELLSRIDVLERMDRVRAVDLAGSCEGPRCRSCPMRKVCGGDPALLPRMYELTDKGRRMVEGGDS